MYYCQPLVCHSEGAAPLVVIYLLATVRGLYFIIYVAVFSICVEC